MVSIIVPCRIVDSYVDECLKHCLELDYPRYEVLLLPDSMAAGSWEDRVKVISTGAVPPSVKRNVGVKSSEGSILAFLDSDAYPDREWLLRAVKYFEDESVFAYYVF